MIISNSQVQSVLNAYTHSQQKMDQRNKDITAEAKLDSLELSDRAQKLPFVKEMALKSQEIRADKVIELKKKVQNGTYRVPASDIADKMVNRSLVDEIARR